MQELRTSGLGSVTAAMGCSEQQRDSIATLAAAKRATRLSFFIAGFSLSSWAPLVPYAQSRLNADSAMLGSVLLCLGLGAMIGMPTAGALSARYGSRNVMIAGSIGLAIAIPLLASLATPLTLGLCLFIFGVCMGAVDVAANIHGNDVQDAAGVPLMSGFHGLYSIGGILGATLMTMLIASGLDIHVASAGASAVIMICMLFAAGGFLRAHSRAQPLFVLPRGIVVVLGLLALATFLIEGAMLDWGALLLTQFKHAEVSVAGSAYTIFACAMTLSRLVGDRVVARIGERRSLIIGMALAGVGVALAANLESLFAVFVSIAMAGLAIGNVVPVLFSLAGRQKAMPPAHAIAAASMLGYLGVLMGPALIGYAAHLFGLREAFYGVGLLMLIAVVTVALSISSVSATSRK